MRTIALVLLFPSILFAQIDTCQTVPFSTRIFLDRGFILPKSIRVYYWTEEAQLIPLPDTCYSVTDSTIQVFLSVGDSLRICYQLLDTSWFPTFYRPYVPVISSDTMWRDWEVFTVPTAPKVIPFFEKNESLRKHGSIGRGITFGTNQDVNVQSDFRLEMEGNLGEGVTIQAAITDANIPVQPDGTTQNIQDFDKVFIRLQKKPFSAILGDFEIQTTNTRFMNFYRNLLGVQLGVQTEAHQAALSFAVAKGKFHTNSFMGENGKQGPYQLIGKNGERLLIVLAGSERVYVNGILKVRGEDYVIDYNTGQITFTNKVLITNVTRIVVDFEYVDRNYTRSMQFLQTHSWLFQKRISLQTLYARDADNPNAPLDFTLTESDVELLQRAGDNPFLAIRSGANTPSTFSSTQILYAKKDTFLYNTYFPEVYYYATDTMQTLYQVTFTYVGMGNGLYRKSQTRVNGNVFEFVGIDSLGNRLGDYEPIRLLPLPKRTQILGIQLKATLTKTLDYQQEIVGSDFDANRLSSLDDADNRDIAFFSQLHWHNDSVKQGRTSFFSKLTFQYVGERFQSIDRVYLREYGREWNYNDLGQRAIERMGEGSGGMAHPFWGRWEIGGGLRQYGDSLFSTRQYLQYQETDSSPLGGHFRTIRIQTEDQKRKVHSLWFRNEGELFLKTRSPWQPGMVIWTETKREVQWDTLMNTSFRFFDLTPYLKRKGKKTDWRLAYQYRYDAIGYHRQFSPKSRFYIPNFTLERSFSDGGQFYWDLKMRFYEVLNPQLVSDSVLREEQWMQELRYANHFCKRSLFFSVTHLLSSQKTPMKEVVYVKVNPGMGQYEWIDQNRNGIEELDEFQPSINPLLANYVRLLLPTGNTMTVTRNELQGTLRWSLKPLVKKDESSFWKGIRINMIQRYVEERKSLVPTWHDYLPTFQNDSQLVSQIFQTGVDIKLFQNRTDRNLLLKWDSHDAIQNLTIGKEVFRKRRVAVQLERKLDRNHSLVVEPRYERNQRSNRLLTNQQYQIDQYGLEVNLLWHRSVYFSWRVGPSYFYKVDRIPRPMVTVHTLKLRSEHRYLPNSGSALTLVQELFYNEKKGASSFGGDFLLLEGMQTGMNYKVSVIWTQKLFGNLQLDLMYDGRYGRGMVPIHAMRTQVRAFF